MSTLIEIKTEEDWNKHTTSIPASTLQVISFHAPWAAPCTQMRTVLELLASSYPVTSPLSTSWVSMNAEEVMDVSDAFDVTAVPYLVLTRNNQVLETVSGSDATKVRTAVEKHAKASGAGTTSNTNNVAATNGGTVAKNLSTYAPTPSDPATAPAYSSSDVKEDKEALHERLETLVKAAPVMLFMKGTPTTPQCGFSRQLVALLRENSVKYGFFNILADDDVRQGLKEFSDWPTFPQLYVDGELVGGLDIVKEEMSNDPEFFKAFSVAKTSSGPETASQQKTTTV
ncbi:thioredoxin-like protein [Amylocarpus encephaloides]|uniref:Thioredoxin-like protein n=1 Tax=Amylocarpus encephaloides TaxID=45428 RepID=A0A9P8C5E2_9HELO|nr:thioredoxin-like protein [Amylocarpus encephaloides]